VRTPIVHVPREIRASFVANALAGAAGFGVVGWVFGLSPSYLHEQLHIHITQPVVAGLFAALVVLTNGVTQLVLRRHHSAGAMQLALAGLVTGMGLMAASTIIDSLPVAIVGGVIAGAGAGVSQMNALATIQRIAPEHARGGVTSAYFTICYVAMSLPVLAAGLAADRLGLGVVTAWYFVGVILLAGLAFGRVRAEAVEPADAAALSYERADAATAA
jgi:MFS family permease